MGRWLPRGLVRRCGGAAIAAAVLAGVGVTAYSGVAGAAPQPSISQVRQRVNQLTTQYNRASQTYDQAVQDLATAKAQLARLDKQVARERTAFATVRREVAQIAAVSYEDGDLTSMAALLTSGNPQAVLNAAALLQELSGARDAELALLVSDARQLAATQQKLQRAVLTLAALKEKAAALRQNLGGLLASERATLANLTAAQRQEVAATSIGAGGTTAAVYTGTTSTQAGKAVAFAYAQLGCPYVYGGTGPCQDGYDCSGLVQAAWAAAGVSIPRTTYEQWAALPHIPSSDIQPGDLLYYNGESHVAMYVGNGYIIDAPQPGMDVERIPMNTPWYAENFDGAVRP